MVLGKGRALEGGLSTLLHRALFSFWRYICMIGWMILLSFGFLVVFLLIGMVFGISASLLTQGENSVITPGAGIGWVFLLIIPVYILFLIAMMGLMVLISVSIHGEARDFRLPIHKSFKAMKGNLLRATGSMFLIMTGFVIVYMFLLFALVGLSQTSQGWLVLFTLFIIMFLIWLSNLAWFAFGAIYASRLVPELAISK